MAEENRAQEPGQEQEQEQIQEEELVQEPAEEQKDEQAQEKSGGGLIMPILYALLAAVGAFTLIMIIGIVVTIITRPAQPSAPPSPSPVQAQMQLPHGGSGTDAAPYGAAALSAESKNGNANDFSAGHTLIRYAKKVPAEDTPPAAAAAHSRPA